MIFCTAAQQQRIGDICIKHGEFNLKRVDTFKCLGIVLDSKLMFTEHVACVKSKAYSKKKLLKLYIVCYCYCMND